MRADSDDAGEHISQQQVDLDRLRSCLDGVRAMMDAALQRSATADLGVAGAGIGADEQSDSTSPHVDHGVLQAPAIDRLAERFALTGFERELLILCAGTHLDADLTDLCARLHGDPQRSFATFDLGLRVFNDGNWAPFPTRSTLRHWRLIELVTPSRPNHSALHVSAAVLDFMTGGRGDDPALDALLIEIPEPSAIAASQHALARRITSVLQHTPADADLPIIQLTGTDPEQLRFVGRQALLDAGLALFEVDTQFLPVGPEALTELARSLGRNALLTGCGYFFTGADGAREASSTPSGALVHLLRRMTKAPCLVAADGTLDIADRAVTKIAVRRATSAEQRRLWEYEISSGALDVNARQLADVSMQFDLGARQIHHITQLQLAAPCDGDGDGQTLWDLCRRHCSQDVQGLARVIEPSSLSWDDLVVPERHAHLLHTMVDQFRRRHRVHDEWGFSEIRTGSTGISALFSGSSGTGKTLAARVIGSVLRLDVYHVDLSSIASKYIGDTEKNLERVFLAAERGGAILFFDEADALFGKRTAVRNSHDRYANMTVSYLLQRMDSFTGLSILATNHKEALDDAFVRRLRFIVNLPLPDHQQRAAIWKGAFPVSAPIESLDFDKLADLEISGATIRNIALGAAFGAAGGHGGITMGHLREAAELEFYKMERSLAPGLLDGWADPMRSAKAAERE